MNPTYVLMTYVSGDAIDLIADKTDKEVVAMCMHVLRDIFRDQASSTTFTKSVFTYRKRKYHLSRSKHLGLRLSSHAHTTPPWL
ncbi:hypothetical protein MRX96_038991 [Rhipicephalus microplus]